MSPSTRYCTLDRASDFTHSCSAAGRSFSPFLLLLLLYLLGLCPSRFLCASLLLIPPSLPPKLSWSAAQAHLLMDARFSSFLYLPPASVSVHHIRSLFWLLVHFVRSSCLSWTFAHLMPFSEDPLQYLSSFSCFRVLGASYSHSVMRDPLLLLRCFLFFPKDFPASFELFFHSTFFP